MVGKNSALTAPAKPGTQVVIGGLDFLRAVGVVQCSGQGVIGCKLQRQLTVGALAFKFTERVGHLLWNTVNSVIGRWVLHRGHLHTAPGPVHGRTASPVQRPTSATAT